MTCTEFKAFLLSLLLLRSVCGKGTYITFREEGDDVVMGYCFGADYILAYKSAPEGEQLLGNSSNKNLPNTPANLQGRIQMTEDKNLLGIQIDNLSQTDSGTYRRECWNNSIVANNETDQLFVCKNEKSAKEIVVNNDDGAEIRCDGPDVGLEGTFVRWYQEIQPEYKSTLLLDSTVSLEPVLKYMQGYVEARENGVVLVLHKTVLEDLPQFYCAVFKGKTCLTFQSIYSPDYSENKEVFASEGERVILYCEGDVKQLKWETPLGQMNHSTPRNNWMYVSDEEPSSLSLIIPAISEEHNGTYACIAPLFEIQYSLFLCPKSESLEKSASTGENISLECISSQEYPKRIQWYRYTQADRYEAIGDTFDVTVSIPKDLSGRVELSDSGLLKISNLDSIDGRTYRCVVLNEFLGDTMTTEYDYEKDTDEDEYIDDEYIEDAARCVFKQEFLLKIKPTGRERPEPKESSNVVYGVVGGLLGILAVVVAVALIAKKKLFSTNNNAVIEEAMDPGCTNKLT